MAKFRRVLIANRGEIAVRIIRACKELGLESVAVHSDVDNESMHVKLADESICIGPGAPKDSYLNIPAILSAASITDADVIHPGYGFLAENDRFVELVEKSGLSFIGPSPEAIRQMGNKVEARRTMIAAGVPVVPGAEIQSPEDRDKAVAVGFPLMIKAAAGGGGRGMRLVQSEEDLDNAMERASAEAEAAFGNGDIYCEKFLASSKHIEIQIAGDKDGNVVHFGERDCSTQRRHQKLVEEAPSLSVSPELREEMGASAILAAKSCQYVTIGTVEFMLTPDGEYYFLEMNTRVQVEHPVTEEVAGVDLIKLQIRLAEGESLGDITGGIMPKRHAIECRINAEDYLKDFTPQGGTIKSMHVPGGPGIRVETHVYPGYRIPSNYDSMLMKIIASGSDRNEALIRMRRALDELIIEGVTTTADFHRRYFENQDFIQGTIDTGYVERWLGSTR